jgi:uncharacterized membrane protein
MTNQARPIVISRVGYRAALIAFIGGAGYDIAQVSQLLGFLTPPWDAILIYGFSLLIAAPFMVAMTALHYDTPNERRLWSHVALLMSVVYVIYVTLNYVVQLAIVIPRLATEASLAVLDQTPHSLFWTLDALGYVFLGAATLFAIPVFRGSESRKWVRRFFFANALVTPAIALVYFYPTFSIGLLLLGSPWLITAPGSFLSLALMFRKEALSQR